MKVFIKQTSILVFLVNDLISLKKELAQGQADSIVPIIVQQFKCTPQLAVDFTVQLIRESYLTFIAAEYRLLRFSQHNSPDIISFIDRCKEFAVGNILWRYVVRLPRDTR